MAMTSGLRLSLRSDALHLAQPLSAGITSEVTRVKPFMSFGTDPEGSGKVYRLALSNQMKSSKSSSKSTPILTACCLPSSYRNTAAIFPFAPS